MAKVTTADVCLGTGGAAEAPDALNDEARLARKERAIGSSTTSRPTARFTDCCPPPGRKSERAEGTRANSARFVGAETGRVDQTSYHCLWPSPWAGP